MELVAACCWLWRKDLQEWLIVLIAEAIKRSRN